MMPLRAGNVEFKITGDTRTLDTSLRQSQATVEAFGVASERRFQRFQKDLKAIAEATGLPLAELKKLEDRMKEGLAEEKASKALGQIAHFARLSTAEVRALERQMGLTAKGSQVHFAAMQRDALSLRAILGSLGAPLTIGAVGYLGKGAFDGLFEAGVKADQLDRSFKAITGSASRAREELAYLHSVADKLGQNFWELTDSYKMFLASAQESGYPIQEIHNIFEATIKAGASLGLSSDAMKRILSAMQQMISKGSISMEELRQQLGEHLPGAFALFAKAAGMGEREFRKLVEDSGVLTADILPKVADAFGVKYTGGISEALAAQNKFSEAWEDLKVKMAGAGFIESATKMLRDLTAALNDPAFVQGAQTIATAFGNMLVTIVNAMNTAMSMAGTMDTMYGGIFSTLFGGGKRGTNAFHNGKDNRSYGAPYTLPDPAKPKEYDSSAIMKGVKLSKLDEHLKVIDEYNAKVKKLDEVIKSGTLSEEGLKKAQGDRKLILGAITAENEQYAKSMARGSAAASRHAVEVAKANAQATKILNEVKGKAMEAQASYLGDTWGAKEAKATAEYQKALDGLEVKLAGFKGTEREALEAGLKYWAAYTLGVERAQIAQDKALASLNDFAKFKKTIAGLGFGDPLEAELVAIEAEFQERLKEAGDDPVKIEMAHKINDAQKKHAVLETGKNKNNFASELAQINGEYKKSYEMQIKNLNLSLEYYHTEEERLLILKKINDITSKMNHSFLGLTRIGLNSYAFQAMEEYAQKIQFLLPNIFDTIGNSAEDFFKKMIDGTANLQDTLRSLEKSLLKLGMDLAFATIKAELFGKAFNSGGGGGDGNGGGGNFIGTAIKWIAGLFTQAPTTGFAAGGISYGPQMAMVSEGAYPVEAHIPLPNGRSVPVEMRAPAASEARPIQVTMHITTPDAGSFRQSSGQIAAQMRMAMAAAGRNL